jgi:DNA mismatch endonuclease (patch repair protein)
MAAIRRRDTKPERAIRSLLHAAGKRYRVDLRLDLEGAKPRPDIVFTRARVAVFVDGCFWHCCPEHSRQPSVNGGYWGPKLERNIARDRTADDALTAAGWTVLRVWEHEAPEQATERIIGVLDAAAAAGLASRAR